MGLESVAFVRTWPWHAILFREIGLKEGRELSLLRGRPPFPYGFVKSIYNASDTTGFNVWKCAYILDEYD